MTIGKPWLFIIGIPIWLGACAGPTPPEHPSTTIDLDWVEAYPVVKINGGAWRWLDPGDRVGDAIPVW